MSQKQAVNCKHYEQCLGFEDVSIVTALVFVALVMVIGLFIASFWYRNSNVQPLLLMVSRDYLYFYFVCAVNFIVILVSVTFFNYTAMYSQIFVGITLILTSTSTMLINILGCKYYIYRSYLCTKRVSLRSCMFIGIISLCVFVLVGLTILYLTIDNRKNMKVAFGWFLLFEFSITVIHTSISSFTSKLAQVQWILLMCLAVLYIESNVNTTHYSVSLFLVYCHPILLYCISVASVFALTPVPQLRQIASDILSCFFLLFYLATNINVIYVWFINKHYAWVSLQILFRISGIAFSGYYIKDYYGFVFRKESTSESSGYDFEPNPDAYEPYNEYVPSIKKQKMGQICTYVGVGRLWHAFVNFEGMAKDMIISGKILRVWEMIFELMPVLTLQFYVLLTQQQYDFNILYSISATYTFLSFTLLAILYTDKHTFVRKEGLASGDFSSPGILRLTMMGYTPSQIHKAWNIITQTQQISLDHPQLGGIMRDQLDQMSSTKSPSISSTKSPSISSTKSPSISSTKSVSISPTKSPSIPSMNAPKPMISITVMPKQKPTHININLGSNGMNPMRPSSHIQHLPALMQQIDYQVRMHSVEHFNQESTIPQNADNKPVDIILKHPKKNISWDDVLHTKYLIEHPHIKHLKDNGWSRKQIQQAYFLLTNDTTTQVNVSDDEFLAHMTNILAKTLQFTPANQQRHFSNMSSCKDKMYHGFICCTCCKSNNTVA
eukprot:452520_1